jgi:hypothetical protein
VERTKRLKSRRPVVKKKAPINYAIGQTIQTLNFGYCVVTGKVGAKYELTFPSGYRMQRYAGKIAAGKLKDPYYPTYFGVGYIGEGEYRQYTDHYLQDLWKNLLKRVYSQNSLTNLRPTYQGCRTSKRWHNFQNFCEDITSMPNYDREGFDLDKDLKHFGNKIYSRKYCSFVPRRINSIMSFKDRGDLPSGVLKSGKKGQNGYRGQINNIDTGHRHSNAFYGEDAIRKAHIWWCKQKVAVVTQQAEQYKDDLHKRVYANLSNMTWRDFYEL